MPRKGKKNNEAQKIQVGEHLFDSGEEARYYIMLSQNPDVVAIEIEPMYILLERYTVRCARCRGSGKLESPKTGNPINCSLCKGSGEREQHGITYKPDFRVTYKGGYSESVDVKPSGGFYKNNERFPMKKRLYEALTGETLIIAREKKPVGSGNFTREDK